MLQTGDVLLGRYEVIKLIGKGGMSTVYQVRDLNSRKVLALKDVDRAGKQHDQVVEQSLAAEGRLLKQLSNPHLPQIYEVVEQDKKIMLVMDFIQGESLDKVIAREGAQSVERVLNWGMQICEMFDYLHNQPTPIIYRDMKPANVMLQPDGQLKLIDFGTARTQKLGVQMQADTVCIGTAGFAAPEQFGGIGQSTARTDVFCLGATLYNLVTGHSPYDKPTGILPLEQWNPELANSPISEIISKCTRNDPAERYQTARELYEDLRLASIGAYKSAKRGYSGVLWQRQNTQGIGLLTSGLSGLLQRGAAGQSSRLSKNEGESGGLSKQMVSAELGKGRIQEVSPEVSREKVHHQQRSRKTDSAVRYNQIMVILLSVAGIFAVLAVALVLLGIAGAAAVFVGIALAAASAAVIMVLRGSAT